MNSPRPQLTTEREIVSDVWLSNSKPSGEKQKERKKERKKEGRKKEGRKEGRKETKERGRKRNSLIDPVSMETKKWNGRHDTSRVWHKKKILETFQEINALESWFLHPPCSPLTLSAGFRIDSAFKRRNLVNYQSNQLNICPWWRLLMAFSQTDDSGLSGVSVRENREETPPFRLAGPASQICVCVRFGLWDRKVWRRSHIHRWNSRKVMMQIGGNGWFRHNNNNWSDFFRGEGEGGLVQFLAASKNGGLGQPISGSIAQIMPLRER